MKNLLFIEDLNADGRNTKVVGTLTPEGVWTGNRKLELEVRTKMRRNNINLHEWADRMLLMQLFGGTYLYAVEEGQYTPTNSGVI